MSSFNGWIVGLDCAAQPERFGVAVSRLKPGGSLQWTDARRGRRGESIAEYVAAALERARAREGSDPSVGGDLLVALDAPLGWPAALGPALAAHRAGERLPRGANRLFRRRTDDVIREHLGLRPLEVGADRIARAAVEALRVLDELRRLLQADLELPMSSRFFSPGTATTGRRPPRSAAVEVYPAAVLSVLGLPSRMYKRPDQEAVRDRILGGLEQRGYAELPPEIRATALAQADVLDAVLCVCSGLEFLYGRVVEPEDDGSLAQEGWAWVPDPRSGRP